MAKVMTENNYSDILDSELLKKFDEMGVEADKAIKGSLKLGANILRDEVIRNINTILTKTTQKQREKSIAKWGRAVDKIKSGAVRTSSDGQSYYNVAGILRGDNSKQFYLKFAEYGTSKQVATPVFRPAMIAKESEIEQAFVDNIIKNIEEEWGD